MVWYRGRSLLDFHQTRHPVQMHELESLKCIQKQEGSKLINSDHYHKPIKENEINQVIEEPTRREESFEDQPAWRKMRLITCTCHLYAYQPAFTCIKSNATDTGPFQFCTLCWLNHFNRLSTFAICIKTILHPLRTIPCNLLSRYGLLVENRTLLLY